MEDHVSMDNPLQNLTTAEQELLSLMNWVLYRTEEGEEYFGQVGTDHTQWDMPEELTESDVELLRRNMADVQEEDDDDEAEQTEAAAAAAGGETDTVEEDVDGSQSYIASKEAEKKKEIEGEAATANQNEKQVEDAAATAADATTAAPTVPDTTDAAAVSPATIIVDTTTPTPTPTPSTSSSTTRSSQKMARRASRRGSFHPAPNFKRDSNLLKTPSAEDIQHARQANGRTVQTLSPSSSSKNAGKGAGLRRAVEVLSDSEIRAVLIQLGEEDKSTHAFTRTDMIDIVFDGSRTSPDILTGTIVITFC